jgi:murein DD-endopeptidase MepM/ murein hydrolase activator NlpD
MTLSITRFTSAFNRLLHSPFGLQVLALGFFLMFIMSFRPPYFIGGGEHFGETTFGEPQLDTDFPITEPGFIENFAGVKISGVRETIEDEEGNTITIIRPRRREQTIEYIVKSGDNISKIAHKFSLKISTILQANELTSKGGITPGQKLKIPPTDGIFYTVQAGDTLSEIAKNHEIDTAKIYAYNKIKENRIIADQSIFLPDAKKTFIPRRQVSRPGQTISNGESPTLSSIGFRIRRPTKGILTQGYHRGHYALDIGSKLNTPIYSAAGGKVIKSADGWNYGYGKYIVIDHGNNVQTLYGHFNERKVKIGDEVKAGQLIGLMGNTGNVWGVTGIHLHFELRINGRKVNPNNYF